MSTSNTPMFSVGEHVRIHAPGWPWHRKVGDVLGVEPQGKNGPSYIVRVRYEHGRWRGSEIRYALWHSQLEPPNGRHCPSCCCDLPPDCFTPGDALGRCDLCRTLTNVQTFAMHRRWVAGDLTTRVAARTCYHCWHELKPGPLTCCRCGSLHAGEVAA